MTSGGLVIRPAADCRWDCAALGEVMLRFDPGEGRVRNARSFQVWEGGGEYNVVRALRKAFGLRATVVTAFPDNDVGKLAEDLILQGGVDVGHVMWRPYDGVGRNTRVGLNFTERGFGLRPALGVSDRGHSAASQIAPGEADWDGLFGTEGVRWFHTGGIFAALAPQTPEVVLEAVRAARRHGTVVSFDLNYRASLWNALGDPKAVQAMNREIARHVDVMFGDPSGFKACLGYDAPADFPAFAAAVAGEFGFKVVASTRRTAQSASANDWGAVLWAGGEVVASVTRENLDILDRVGGGDAFASGVAYALLQGLGPQAAVDYGAAHGALAMTTPGDASMVDVREIEAAIGARGASVIR
ncbi:sugar kinase [Phenylobacterium sp.]|uniref:sugar kinase n=1 Tax=Phenylobacterium sp. TaxID=1871053 RepID=UPI0025F439EC|nr:sugar kinase [Phenylobacterium sp.]